MAASSLDGHRAAPSSVGPGQVHPGGSSGIPVDFRAEEAHTRPTEYCIQSSVGEEVVAMKAVDGEEAVTGEEQLYVQ